MNGNSKGFVHLIFILGIFFLVIGGAVYITLTNRKIPTTNTNNPTPVPTLPEQSCESDNDCPQRMCIPGEEGCFPNLCVNGKCDLNNSSEDNTSLLGGAETEEDCISLGGTWQKWGLIQKEYCQIPADDSGDSCIDGAECKYGCISQDGSIPGKCQTYENQFGCFSIIEEGVAGQALCVD